MMTIETALNKRIFAVFVGYISEDREQKRLEPIVITSNLIGINTYYFGVF